MPSKRYLDRIRALNDEHLFENQRFYDKMIGNEVLCPKGFHFEPTLHLYWRDNKSNDLHSRPYKDTPDNWEECNRLAKERQGYVVLTEQRMMRDYRPVSQIKWLIEIKRRYRAVWKEIRRRFDVRTQQKPEPVATE
jgi:hypothetical protein